MIKTKVAFVEGRLLSSQSEQFKAGPLKKPLLFWSCKQANCFGIDCNAFHSRQ